jgi:hypothetical protein
MSSNKPVLFYSKKCVNCQKLWGILTQENRLNDFIKICVEENPTKIPPMIREVPSILISRDRPVISGAAIHMYLKSASAMPVSSQSGKPDFTQKPNLNKAMDKIPQFESSTNELNGIKDYSPIEMGSAWSDSYSFIQDNPEPMKFSFEFLDNSQTSQNSQMNAVDQTKKGKNGDLDARYQMLLNSRK